MLSLPLGLSTSVDFSVISASFSSSDFTVQSAIAVLIATDTGKVVVRVGDDAAINFVDSSLLSIGGFLATLGGFVGGTFVLLTLLRVTRKLSLYWTIGVKYWGIRGRGQVEGALERNTRVSCGGNCGATTCTRGYFTR